MEQYYYVKDGQRLGPISPEQFVANGVTAETLVWTQGMTDWKPASTIPELAPYLSVAPVPPPIEPQPQPQPQPQPYTGGYNPGGFGGQMYGAAGQPYNPPPGNNMVWAILSTLFCCLPFGIVSIVYANKVDNLWAMGNYQAALDAKKKSKNWAIAAAVSAIVVTVLYLVIVFVGIGAAASYGSSW